MKNFIPKLGNYNFSLDLKRLNDLYDYINQEKYLCDDLKYNFMTGDPIEFKPYYPSIKAIKNALKRNDLYQYQPTNGTYNDKKIICNYLNNIGIEAKIQNIMFTYSTTHAFNLIFSCLSKSGDAIIIPEPNYGLFDFIPERYNIKVITIPLKKENDWFIDPNELEKTIKKYNEKRKFKSGIFL